MKFIDVLLLVIVLGYCAWVLYNHFNPKDGCTHVCSSCSATSCHINDFKRDLKEAKEKEFKK